MPYPTQLSENQIVNREFDPINDAMRVNVVTGSLNVTIGSISIGNVKIQDGTSSNLLLVNPDGSIDTNVILNGPTDNIALTDPLGNPIYPATSGSINSVNQTLLAIMNTTGVYGIQTPVTVNQGTSPWVITGSVTINNPGGGSSGGTVTQGPAGVSPWLMTGSVGISGPVTITNTSFSVTQGTIPWQTTGSVTINNAAFGAVQSGTWTVGLSAGSNNIGSVNQGTNPWIVSGSVGISGTVTFSNASIGVTQSTSPWVCTGSVTMNNSSFGAVQNGNWSMRLQDGSGIAITSTGGALDVNIKTPVGQAAMSASIPVVLASNQTALPVISAPSPASVALSTFVTGSVQNVTVVKVSSGRIHYLHVYNPNTSYAFLQFYDLASGSVHVGTTTPTMTWAIPPVSVLDTSFENPVPAANAITLAGTNTFTGGTALNTPLSLSLMYI